MADVFISYHEDSAGKLAEQIADALDEAGISCWCARRDMLFGGNFAHEIPAQIHDCRLFLLLLNENVYHSEHIENELGIAFSRRNKKEDIRILPLELGKFVRKDWVEYYLIHAQSVKFPPIPNEQYIRRLVKQIAKTLNQETPELDVNALFQRGEDYYYGRNGVEDSEKALKYYEEASTRGHAGALYRLGTIYESRYTSSFNYHDYAKAWEFFSEAAAKGNADALYYLGWLYENGQGAQDCDSEQSYIEQAMMGLLGSVTQDYAKALEYYKKAVDAGYTLDPMKIEELRKKISG